MCCSQKRKILQEDYVTATGEQMNITTNELVRLKKGGVSSNLISALTK